MNQCSAQTGPLVLPFSTDWHLLNWWSYVVGGREEEDVATSLTMAWRGDVPLHATEGGGQAMPFGGDHSLPHAGLNLEVGATTIQALKGFMLCARQTQKWYHKITNSPGWSVVPRHSRGSCGFTPC